MLSRVVSKAVWSRHIVWSFSCNACLKVRIKLFPLKILKFEAPDCIFFPLVNVPYNSCLSILQPQKSRYLSSSKACTSIYVGNFAYPWNVVEHDCFVMSRYQRILCVGYCIKWRSDLTTSEQQNTIDVKISRGLQKIRSILSDFV